MTEAWHRPVARIWAGGKVVGAGVLVPGSVVLTCAHVVTSALAGKGAVAGSGATVQLDFPFAGTGPIVATVAPDGWHPEIDEAGRGRNSLPSDLAVLRLDDAHAIEGIGACLISESDPSPATPFSSQGFPAGFPNGALSEGVLREPDAGGWLDAVAESAYGHFVDPGFSGAPLFAREAGVVRPGTCLGLCVTRDAGGQRRIARMIPPAQLAQVAGAVVSPYRWLEAFEERDVPFFFGRDELSDELWRELQERRLIVIAGGTGIGKSSVLRAGLARHARASGREVHIVRPLDDLRAELAAAYGLDKEAALEALTDAVRAAAAKQPQFLAIDQAEELVRRGNADSARELLQCLAELRSDLEHRLLIVCAVRGDMLDALLAVQPRMGGRTAAGLFERHLRFLDPLGREELQLAIERPAARLRIRYADGLAAAIVDDVLHRQVPLPIVQLCLSRLWQERSDGEISHAAYRSLGGVTGALAHHAERVLADLERQAEAATKANLKVLFIDPGAIFRRQLIQVRLVLLSLVDVGMTERDDRRKRPVPLAQLPRLERGLLAFFVARTAEAMALKALEQSRLVVMSRQPDGTDAMELAHDALLTEWDTLRRWVNEARTFRRWHDRLLQRARETPEDVLAGAALDEADRMVREAGAAEGSGLTGWWRRLIGPAVDDLSAAQGPHPDVVAFVKRSREAQDQRDRTEAARLEAEREAAMRQEARAMAALARTEIARGNCMSAMLALLETLPNPDAERNRPDSVPAAMALTQALLDNRELASLIGHESPVWHSAWGPDGRVLTASDDRTARVWREQSDGRWSAAALEGHGGSVHHATWGPDGRVLTASDDCTARVWREHPDGCWSAAVLAGHGRGVNHAAWDLDGRVLTASADGTARVWREQPDGRWTAAVLKGHGAAVKHAVWGPDGRVLTASLDGTARVWREQPDGRWSAAALEGHGSGVHHATWGPDGRVLTSSDDWTARVWREQPDGSWNAAKLEGHGDNVNHAAWNLDGRVLTASDDHTTRVWSEQPDGRWSAVVLEGHEDCVNHVACGPDRRVLTASDDGTARVWREEQDGRWSAGVFKGHGGGVHHATWGSDGRVLTASTDGTARVWREQRNGDAMLDGHEASVNHVAWGPDGRVLTASDDRTAQVWCQQPDERWIAAVLEGHGDRVVHAAWGQDGRVLTASNDGTARVWREQPDGRWSTAVIEEDGGNSVILAAWGPGGRVLTAGVDGTAHVWHEQQDGRWSASLLEGHGLSLTDAAWGQDARVLTASRDRTARVWHEHQDGVWSATVLEGHGDSVNHLAWWPDGRVLTASSDGTARVWREQPDGCWSAAVLKGHSGSVDRVAWGLDGRVLTASADCTARVWCEQPDGRWSAAVLAGHGRGVNHAAWGPAGSVLTASADGTARVWREQPDGRWTAAVLKGHSGIVLHAAWAPDGRVLTASGDGTARIWRVPATTAEAVAAARLVLTRQLTVSQRDAYGLPIPDWQKDWPRDRVPPPPATDGTQQRR